METNRIYFENEPSVFSKETLNRLLNVCTLIVVATTNTTSPLSHTLLLPFHPNGWWSFKTPIGQCCYVAIASAKRKARSSWPASRSMWTGNRLLLATSWAVDHLILCGISRVHQRRLQTCHTKHHHHRQMTTRAEAWGEHMHARIEWDAFHASLASAMLAYNHDDGDHQCHCMPYCWRYPVRWW